MPSSSEDVIQGPCPCIAWAGKHSRSRRCVCRRAGRPGGHAMDLGRHARVRAGGPAGTAILASAALAVSMTVLAGAGPSAAAPRPGEAPRGLTTQGSGSGRAAHSAAPDGTISTVAGGVGGPAVATGVNLGVSTPIAGTTSSPCGIAFGSGQLLVADSWTVRSIDPATGRLTTPVGTAASGPFRDGGPAAAASVDTCAVAVDAAGNLVIADAANDRIRVAAAASGTFYGQQMTAGDVYTVAGTGIYGFSADGTPATSARLSDPAGVAVDAAGNLVIASNSANRVQVIAEHDGSYYGVSMTSGDIYTVAGDGTAGYTGDGGPAASATLDGPQGVTVDAAGNLVVADTGNSVIRVVAGHDGRFYGQQMSAGNIYTIAGDGTAGYTGDGGPATGAQVSSPSGVAADGAGDLVIADSGNSVIRVVAATTGTLYGQHMTAGDIYTIAGTGTAGYTGDGGRATSARLSAPVSVTADATGNLVIADGGNNVIRVVAAATGTFYGVSMTAGDIYTVAGTGTAGYTGDGGRATGATLYYPQGATVDGAGNLVIADTGNNVIRVVAGQDGTFYGTSMTAGDIYTVAGTGDQGFSGDGGPATSAGLTVPASVAVDAAGNVIIADYGDNRARAVAASTGTYYGVSMTAGDIYTIAGAGDQGFSGDGGPAASATLHYPQGVTVDGSGDVLVTDSGNNRVRLITGSNPAAGVARPRAAAGPAASGARAVAPSARGHAARAGAPATAGPYVTLLFSRTETGAADNCMPDDSGIAPLDTVVAPYLRSLGMTGTGTLVTGMTQATVAACTHFGDSLASSWANAAGLATNFGWSFVSHTATYPGQLGKLTPTQSYAETCGSAAVLDGYGRPGGHGLIAYPGMQNPPVALQADYGANCFAWGRTYNKSGTTPAANGTTAPYWQETEAVNGGACHVSTAPCYTVTSGANGNSRYDEPSTIIARIQALQPGQWFTLQAYILVTGTNPGYSNNATRWDCTSTDPALHWTNDDERYCYSDWQQIVNAIAAMPSITVTDPLTVGVAFGRPASYP